ncbi:MAG: restriction endonuclease subunit S [Bacteroidales bacterium]|nr:restriction endonuclease subunit S [Bacteroidales bacterium]
MKKRLKDVLDYEQPTKYIVDSQNYSEEFKTPVLTAGKSFILGYTDEAEGVYEASKNPVIIFDDFTSASKYVDFDFKVKSSAMKILHLVNPKDSLRYVYYAMQKINYVPFSHKRLWISDYCNFEIELPDSSIQNRVVADLDTIQKAIDLKRKQLEDLDELVKSKFQEMFGDESKFDKQPLSKSVVEMFIGPFGSALKNECFVDREQGHCIVYEQKHAIKKTIDLPARYITEEKYNELRRFTVLPDDIIISCRGTIGEVYTIPQGAPLGVIHPSLMKIRLKSGVYNNVFFTYIIEKYMQEHAYKAVGNCVKMAVTATVLGKESFIVPSKKMQDDFAQYDKGVRKAKEIVQHEIDDLEELMDSKMDEYFG